MKIENKTIKGLQIISRELDSRENKSNILKNSPEKLSICMKWSKSDTGIVSQVLYSVRKYYNH